MASEVVRNTPAVKVDFILSSSQDDFLSPAQAEGQAESGHGCHTLFLGRKHHQSVESVVGGRSSGAQSAV
jgi:hypothetical protein